MAACWNSQRAPARTRTHFLVTLLRLVYVQVTEADICTFLFASNIPGGFAGTGNGTAALYTGNTFDPTSPCENIIAQNDQAYNPTNTSIILAPGGGLAVTSFSPEMRVSLPLVPGQTYIVDVVDVGTRHGRTIRGR